MGKSYAEKIDDTNVMIAGLKANAERVLKRGITQDFVARYEAKLDEVQDLNNEQEALKGQLNSKTKQLNEKMTEMKILADEAKKVVKLEFEQPRWKEFGVDDKI